MRSFPAALLCGIAALMVATTACSFGEARYREDVHTRVSAVPDTLKLDDPVGAVTIEAWTNRYVQIDAVKRAPSPDALHDITVSVQPSGDTLNVGADLGGGNNRSVDFTIHVPATTNVNVDASVGDVQVTGFIRNVAVDASVGRVRVDMGALTRGQIVDLKTSVGEITLTVPGASSATIDADTSIGSVKGDVGFSLQRSTTGATGHAVLGAGAAQVTLSASTGSIHVNRE